MVQESETQEPPNLEPAEETPPPSPGGGSGIPPIARQFIVGIAAAVVVVAAAAGINHAWPIFGTSGGGGGKISVSIPTAAAATPSYLTADSFAKSTPVPMDVADAPTKGPENAKVTIVEFSDFECPYCDRFVTQTLPQILSAYGDKITFAFRNYPLPASMHPYAEKAAEAGECANDQGAFWQYHDLLFQNQNALAALVQADATNGVTQVVAKMEEYAGTLGLDTAKFNQCLDSSADKAKVDSDQKAMTDALSAAGVTSFGTPSFFINGRFVSGAYPFDANTSGYKDGMFTFKQAIDDLLAGS